VADRRPREWVYVPNNPKMRSRHQQRVDEFMANAGQVVPRQPEMPPVETRRLRAGLILEEALETVYGLGFEVRIRCGKETHYMGVGFKMVMDSLDETHPPDMIEIVDGCCDIKVVTTGTLSALGIPDLEHQRMVDVCNLAKFGPGGHKDDAGKWIKPPDWKAPRTGALLHEQGWRGLDSTQPEVAE